MKTTNKESFHRMRDVIFRVTMVIVLINMLFSFQLNAQEEKNKKGYMARRDSVKEAKIAEGRGVLSVLGGPGYTPELQLIIGIGSLYSFKTNREDSLIQQDFLHQCHTLPLVGFVCLL